MKIATIVGARPQFIKAAPVSRALRESGCRELLIHTGQHYDYGMSRIFFEEMGIPEPDLNLAVGSGRHGWQTAQMLMQLESSLISERPDWVIVYGDTNSTLAGALAACKLRIRLAHVEAGLRSFNREMPEEHNRVLTDHCADLLLCPTKTAIENLARGGIVQNAFLVGDTMYDAVLQFAEVARRHSTILQDLDLRPKQYLLATVHRAYNTDNLKNLRDLLRAFREIDETVVFPVHPRLRAKDWVVTMEGDYTSRHELLRQMLIRTEEDYDVVLASPYMYGGGIAQTTAWRIFFSYMANIFVKEFLGIHGILTMSSIYRLHRGEVIKKLQMLYGPRIIDRKGFESMIEMLLKMLYLQTKISEVPMLLDTSRRIGKSKMKILKTILGYLGLWKDKRRWREVSSKQKNNHAYRIGTTDRAG